MFVTFKIQPINPGDIVQKLLFSEKKILRAFFPVNHKKMVFSELETEIIFKRRKVAFATQYYHDTFSVKTSFL